MRNKRAKTYKKLLASYIRHFGLRAPLQVLIDAPMAVSLAAMKVGADDVYTRLESVLQVSAALPSGSRPQNVPMLSQGASRGNKAAAYVKPMITQCAITELYKTQKEGDAQARAVELAKGWERRFCNHREAIPGDRCMRDVIGDTNKHRYVLAANSAALRFAIRKEVPGVPVVHVNDHKVIVLEPMSDLTRRRCEELESEKMKSVAGVLGKRRAGEGEALDNVIGADAAANGEVGSVESQPPPIKRKKKAKGPNPLSMKKPKKDKAKLKPSSKKKASV